MYMGVIAAGAVLAAGMAGGAAVAAADRVEIGQRKPGNVFTPGVRPSVTVTANVGEVRWSIHNYTGTEVAHDTKTIDGPTRLDLPVRASGWYTLKVTGGTAGTGTTFAVLPHADRGAAEPFTYAMQTHFSRGPEKGWDPEIVPLMRYIGVESTRDAVRWADVEKEKGTYTFPARYGAYMAALKRNGIDPLTNFGQGNKHYNNGGTPWTKTARAGFATYAARVLREYPRIGKVGVFNEPNLEDPGDAWPARHAAIARAIDDKVGGTVTVAAPELSAGIRGNSLDLWPTWLDRYLQEGGKKHLDAVSVHTYRTGKPPEGLNSEQLDVVRAKMRKHGIGGKPLWITEMGWQSENVGERPQARWLPRAYVLAMANRVSRFHWYEFADSVNDRDKLSTFGLIHKHDSGLGRYVPKPSYVTYAVMTAQLSGLKFAGTDDMPKRVRGYRFTGNGGPVHVLWTPSGERTVKVRTSGPVRVTGPMGNTRGEAPGADGTVSVRVTEDPVYVRGGTIG